MVTYLGRTFENKTFIFRLKALASRSSNGEPADHCSGLHMEAGCSQKRALKHVQRIAHLAAP